MDLEKLEGHLLKQGHSTFSALQSWKKRLFVLRPTENTLDYYDDSKNPRALKGSIELKRGARVLDAPTPEHAFVVISASGTRYPLQASSQDEKARWMRTISALLEGEREVETRYNY